jgi:uncharacterized protein
MPADRVAVDANVLVYALYRDAPQQRASRAFLETGRRGEVILCLTSQVLAEFFSIVTSAKRVSNPRTPEDARAVVEAMLARQGAVILPVVSEVVKLWLDMLHQHPVRAGAVFDLQLVATMVANGVSRICTFNGKDFEGFAGVDVISP